MGLFARLLEKDTEMTNCRRGEAAYSRALGIKNSANYGFPTRLVLVSSIFSAPPVRRKGKLPSPWRGIANSHRQLSAQTSGHRMTIESSPGWRCSDNQSMRAAWMDTRTRKAPLPLTGKAAGRMKWGKSGAPRPRILEDKDPQAAWCTLGLLIGCLSNLFAVWTPIRVDHLRLASKETDYGCEGKGQLLRVGSRKGENRPCGLNLGVWALILVAAGALDALHITHTPLANNGARVAPNSNTGRHDGYGFRTPAPFNFPFAGQVSQPPSVSTGGRGKMEGVKDDSRRIDYLLRGG